MGGGPALIDEAPFAATHSHDRTDFLHRTNPVTEWDNPLGLDGFEFVEFTGPDPAALANLFSAMGFAHAATHRSKKVRLYRQGDINFILNMEPSGQAANFRSMRSEEHTSELQSLMRNSYAVFCLKKKKKTQPATSNIPQQ